MSDLTKLRPENPTADVALESPPQLPVITEHEVRFATAAAGVAIPTRPRRWTGAIQSVAGAVRAVAARPRKPARPYHRHRLAFLESSLMAREMERL